MTLTTTSTIEGHKVTDYRGIVVGEAFESWGEKTLLSTLRSWETFFWSLGNPRAFGLGVLIGLLSVLGMAILGKDVGFGLSFLLYFPFHALLMFAGFSVLVSKEERQRIAGEFSGPIVAFFWRVYATPFGLFCVSWFYTLLFVGWLSGAIQ